ncbi:protein neuralized-like isoform X1 [Clavelina lepadiformis]|uniref:protein neuralized-like isoform X1 n=1 Tax=Clavelina lepadiformis TaxID=159417 RepID=UPI0040427C0E
MKQVRLEFIDQQEDIIEKERRLHQPKHKRLEYVAGWNIHQLVKDAKKCRPTLHTRQGFYLKSSVSDIASVYSYRSSKSKSSTSRRSCMTTVTSPTLSTTFRLYDILRFHPAHGSNVVLSNDRQVASRKTQSFCNGIVFGHRPVKFGETVHLRFNKVRTDWRGCVRLGFTPHNPTRCDPKSLPRYAVPDLRRRSRFWAVPIAEKYATKYNIFSFMCKEDGSVSYMINNEGKGTFLTGLETKISLWPMLDLYGKVEEIAIVDDEAAELGAAILGHVEDEDEEEEDLGSGMSPGKRGKLQSGGRARGDYVMFHETRGKNVKLDLRQTTAKRFDSFWNSLSFTRKPLRRFDMTFLEILKVESNYAGGLGVGATNMNPATMKSSELPDNAELLTVKPAQYWRISRDIETEEGDQLGFVLDGNGQITYSKNGNPQEMLFSDVPVKDPIWLIFDIYGSTTMIKLMGRITCHDPSDTTNVGRFAFDNIQEDETEKECLMCFKKDRSRDCTIQPCGHTTLCHWCAITCMVKQQLRFIVCPVCGGPVNDVVRILRRKYVNKSPEVSVDEENEPT